MKFREYIETNQVFTTEDVYGIASIATARTQLRRALERGDVERVRRGTYVSKVGKYRGEVPDPFLVASIVDSHAIISYHSALAAHGVAHNVSFVCSFRSSTVSASFEYGDVSYRPYDNDDEPAVQIMRSRAYGAVIVTTREQTLVDCLSHPRRAGGIEEVVRSCSAFPYVDLEALVSIVKHAPTAVVARIGWLLEGKAADWGIRDDVLALLESRLGRGPAKLDPGSRENRGWSRRWRLYLPEDEAEVCSWIG